MPTLEKTPTLAVRAAQLNLRTNRRALLDRDGDAPDLSLPPGELVFARDGAVSTIDCLGRFHRGCSVPLLAAERQLKSVAVSGQCACLLDPMHAAAVQVALRQLRPGQSLLVVVPDTNDAALLFSAADFSNDIADHRLWVVFGADWPGQIEQLLARRSGLAIPAEFIRPAATDQAFQDELIGRAQQTLKVAGARRQERLRSIRNSARSPRGRGEIRRVCVIGNRRFSPWCDSGFELGQALSAAGVQIRSFHSDDPCCASHVALAECLIDCDAVVAADVFRSEADDVAPADMPWITWLTQRRMSAPGNCDGLIVADPARMSEAASAGWPADRLAAGTWCRWDLGDPPTGAPLVMLADVSSLDAPADLEEMSSHRLLWETLADQIRRNPFAAFDAAEEMLSQVMKRLNIDDAGLPRRRFVEQLIQPAFAVAIATELIRSSTPLALYGRGWDGFPDLCEHWEGSVTTRRAMRSAVASARAMVHALPESTLHPIDFCGRAVIRPRGGVAALFQQISSPLAADHPPPSALSGELILRLISVCQE